MNTNISFFDSNNVKHTMKFDNYDDAIKYIAQTIEFGFDDIEVLHHEVSEPKFAVSYISNSIKNTWLFENYHEAHSQFHYLNALVDEPITFSTL